MADRPCRRRLRRGPVEARRITVDTTRIASESFPMAVPPEEAERRCRRALMEAWVGRGDRRRSVCRPRASRSIRPTRSGSRMTDGWSTCGFVSIADAEARGIEAVRQDRATLRSAARRSPARRR